MKAAWSPLVVLVAVVLPALVAAPGARGQAPPSYDFQFATVGAVGNAAFNNPSYPFATVSNGRGTVNYEFRMSKLEVTTGQWMEFINTFSTQNAPGFLFQEGPSIWGAQRDPTYFGPGVRFKLKNAPNAAMRPVTGISWRDAAMFCNWLHNGKGSALSAYQNGAYDTSTFTTNPNGTFNDQVAHSPGARYWIPTFDEALKSQHYDPDRYGQGRGGWWLYPNMSDDPPIGGPPGQGQTNAGFGLPFMAEWDIPLGSYPDVVSPWGLLDAAGANSEWNEYIFFDGGDHVERGLKGSFADGGIPLDHANALSSEKPDTHGVRMGLRIVSAVPSPGAAAGLLLAVLAGIVRRRR